MSVRLKMLKPEFVNRAANLLQILYKPALLLPVLLTIAGTHAWMYSRGVESAVYNVIYTPGALLTVFVVIMCAGLFHELGHAAALRYGGGHARAIGVGLYLIFPAFYTDVTDSYRLSRTARLRTDLGGVYFHAMAASGLIALASFTGSDALLLSAVLINLDILRQFIPFVRLDGYWILADLSGIPDFFSQMGPFLRSILPIRGMRGARLPQLRPLARLVFAAYTLAVVPFLGYMFVLLVVRLPWFVDATNEALLHQLQFLTPHNSPVIWVLAIAQMLLLALPVLGSVLIVVTVTRAIAAIAATLFSARMRQFAGGMAAAAALAAAAMFATAPSSAPALAQQAALSEVALIIERARTAIMKTPALAARVEGVLGTDRFVGELVLQRPNLARVDISGSEGLGVFRVIANAGSTAIYFPAQNEFSRFAAGHDGRHITALIVDQVRHFFRPETVLNVPSGARIDYIGVEMLNGTQMDVLEVIPGSVSARVVRYFISSKDGIVHRMTWRAPSAAPQEATSWVQLKELQTSRAPNLSAFQWAVPPDAKPLQLPLSLQIPGT